MNNSIQKWLLLTLATCLGFSVFAAPSFASFCELEETINKAHEDPNITVYGATHSPANLRVIRRSPTEMLVTWDAPFSPNARTVAKYEILRLDESGRVLKRMFRAGHVTLLIDRGLAYASNSFYYRTTYRIRAIFDNGDTTDYVEPVYREDIFHSDVLPGGTEWRRP